MKKIVLSLLVFFALLAAPGRARADIDHACLNQCLSAGDSTAACLPRCSYGIPAGTAAPAAKSMSHGVFNSLTPTDGATVLKPKAAAPAPSKDYACFNQCLQQHNAYQLCEAQCTKSPCPVGSVSCRNLTGVVNGAAAPPR